MPVTPTEFIINSSSIETPGSINALTTFLNNANMVGSSLTPQAIVTGNTVTLTSGQSYVKLTLAGAATGVILPVGTVDGQLLMISISTAAANTLTFAAAATSHVAGGAGVSLAGLAAHLFVWSAVDSLWFQVGPLTN